MLVAAARMQVKSTTFSGLRSMNVVVCRRKWPWTFRPRLPERLFYFAVMGLEKHLRASPHPTRNHKSPKPNPKP